MAGITVNAYKQDKKKAKKAKRDAQITQTIAVKLVERGSNSDFGIRKLKKFILP